MKYIVSGTDREDSTSLKLSRYVQKIYQDLGETVEIIDLRAIRSELSQGPHYGTAQPASLQKELSKINQAEGLIVVCPEYNGSMPGILKYYIDHLKFPEAFEFRPICFVGLGAGAYGGVRPVEHLQQVFGYRNAFIFPQRVFLPSVHKVFQNGAVTDSTIQNMLRQQAEGFRRFCSALHVAKLDANSVLAQKAAGV